MDRLTYLIKRMLLVIPTFIGLTRVCFSLTRFLPGGPVELRMMRAKGMSASVQGASAPASAANSVSDEYRKELEARFGFDKPLCVQYWDWLVVNRMGLNLPSYDYPDKTAWQLISKRIPISIWFGLASFLLTYLVSVILSMRCRARWLVISL